MNCLKAQQLFDERLDGQLDLSQQQALDAHLAHCAVCHDQWQAYAASWEILGQYKLREPSHGFVERTMRRLDEMPEPRWHMGWTPAWRWVALGVTAFAISAGGWFGWHRRNHETSPMATVYAQVNHGSFFDDLEVIASLNELKSSLEEAP